MFDPRALLPTPPAACKSHVVGAVTCGHRHHRSHQHDDRADGRLLYVLQYSSGSSRAGSMSPKEASEPPSSSPHRSPTAAGAKETATTSTRQTISASSVPLRLRAAVPAAAQLDSGFEEPRKEADGAGARRSGRRASCRSPSRPPAAAAVPASSRRVSTARAHQTCYDSYGSQ